MGSAMTDTPADPIAAEARDLWFEFLCRKYVQRADERQAAMGLQYTEAETNDLAKECATFAQRQSAGRAEASDWRLISDEQPRDTILVWDDGTLSSDPGVKVWRAGSQKITTPGITHWMPLPSAPEGGDS